MKNRLRLYITFYPKAQAGGIGGEARPYVPLDASWQVMAVAAGVTIINQTLTH